MVSHLDKEQQPETLMVYCGLENTYTPGHTDICGSLGHNLMVASDPEAYALWFIAESKDKAKASALWGKYGAALDHDNCFLPVEKLAEADFTFHVVRQRRGDLVFVPPEGAHQVINKGGRSIKIAWNRVTPSTIAVSYHSVLPLYHQICKAEVYRIKTLVYCGLQDRIKMVKKGIYEERLAYEFPPLLQLFDEIICEEWVSPQILRECSQKLEKERFPDRVPHLRTCNFCNLDIFNRCYRCPSCTDDYDICLACIAEGRGCTHNEQLVLMEHISMTDLRTVLKEGKSAFKAFMVATGKSLPIPPQCDFNDQHSVASLAFQMVSRYKETEEFRCHQCKRRKRQYLTVDCPTRGCGKTFCAMCLWNRYGIQQYSAQRDKKWKCPLCKDTCNCAACLRKRGINPKDHEVLANMKALYDISVVLPAAFKKNSSAIAGVCDVAPKPARSQGYSVKDMEKAKGGDDSIKRERESSSIKSSTEFSRPRKRVKYEESDGSRDSESESDEDHYSQSESDDDDTPKKRKKETNIKRESRSQTTLRLSSSAEVKREPNLRSSGQIRSSTSSPDKFRSSSSEVKREPNLRSPHPSGGEKQGASSTRGGGGKQPPQKKVKRSIDLVEQKDDDDDEELPEDNHLIPSLLGPLESPDPFSPIGSPTRQRNGQGMGEEVKLFPTSNGSLKKSSENGHVEGGGTTTTPHHAPPPVISESGKLKLKLKMNRTQTPQSRTSPSPDLSPRDYSSSEIEVGPHVSDQKNNQQQHQHHQDQEGDQKPSSRVKVSLNSKGKGVLTISRPKLSSSPAPAPPPPTASVSSTNTTKKRQTRASSRNERDLSSSDQLSKMDLDDDDDVFSDLISVTSERKSAPQTPIINEIPIPRKRTRSNSIPASTPLIDVLPIPKIKTETGRTYAPIADGLNSSTEDVMPFGKKRKTKREELDEDEFVPTGAGSGNSERKKSRQSREKMQLSSDFEEEHEIIPKSYRSAQNLNSMRDHQQNFASVETRPKIQKSSNENSGGGKAGEREPKRALPAQRNDYVPYDYESSVLTFSHPGITYEEYLAAFNSRSARPRKIRSNGYWCPCGLIKSSSQFFASHTKVCPVYRACQPQNQRTADDPIFKSKPEPKFLEPLCTDESCEDSCCQDKKTKK